jgi:uncharacterized protein (TIGR03067 family)
MRRCVVPLAVLMLGFAPAPLPRKAARIAEPRLDGEWKEVSWDMRIGNGGIGRVVRSVRIASRRLETCWEGDYSLLWTMTFPPSSWPPHVDVRVAGSGKVLRGIFKLEGDALTICYAEEGKARPTEFHNDGQWRLVLKRKR